MRKLGTPVVALAPAATIAPPARAIVSNRNRFAVFTDAPGTFTTGYLPRPTAPQPS